MKPIKVTQSAAPGQRLRVLCLGNSLSVADFDVLSQILEETRMFKRRTDLVVEGYHFCKIGIVESGIAAQYKLLRNGRRQILDLLLAGDLIGFSACFSDRARFSVSALSELHIRSCRFETFMQACRERPALAMALVGALAERHDRLAARIVTIGRRTPVERVAHFLLDFCFRQKRSGIGSWESFELPLSQEVIGDLIGLSVSHVNRVLRELRMNGLIAVEGQTFRLKDIEELESIAQFQRPQPASMSPPCPEAVTAKREHE